MCYNIGMAKYELLSMDEHGNEVRLYENGHLRNQNGQLLTAPPNAVKITAETSHAYNRRRKEKILEEIEKSVMDITRTNVPAEAIGAIVGKRAKVAMTDEGKTGNDAARIVLQALDAYQERVEETRTNVLRHEYVIDDETIALLEKITRMKRDEVIDSDDYTK
jgi:hypothetical protein